MPLVDLAFRLQCADSVPALWMPYYAVWLSDNPGPSVEDDGPPKKVIVTEVKERLASPPATNLFAIACSQLELGHPRISAVLPYLQEFNPVGWRSVAIASYVFWTNCEPNSFPSD